jgi:hypothetical protein
MSMRSRSPCHYVPVALETLHVHVTYRVVLTYIPLRRLRNTTVNAAVNLSCHWQDPTYVTSGPGAQTLKLRALCVTISLAGHPKSNLTIYRNTSTNLQPNTMAAQQCWWTIIKVVCILQYAIRRCSRKLTSGRLKPGSIAKAFVIQRLQRRAQGV